MRAFLLSCFIALWYSNYYICSTVYPYDYAVEDTWQYFADWYYLRDRIYEVMFLILVSAFSFKKSRLSNAIAIGAVVLLSASVLDKWVMGVFDFQLHDVYVFLASAVVGLKYYYGRKRNS